MRHAHIGFRSSERTAEAMATIHAAVADAGGRVDRFGITLDWSMGYPAALREGRPRSTGIVLGSPDEMALFTNASPAACHFGDFMLGLPGAMDNVPAALQAGVTAIGNLGQYFTFRLPYWDDDVATTEATVEAIALIAAQPVPVLVHSNLDDGFAALFRDMVSSIGMVLVERYVVEELLGGHLATCYGHHFSEPLTRHAFHAALARVSVSPGSMIYGNTVAYRSTPAGNYAHLASYLFTDIIGLTRHPTGHAINPVPVTENERIPDVDEIIDAQVFADRAIRAAPGLGAVADWREADAIADRLVEGGEAFKANVLAGLADDGIDITDAAQVLLALKRLGARAIEARFAVARADDPAVKAGWVTELEEMAQTWRQHVPEGTAATLSGLRVAIATSDVHEHGKHYLETALAPLGLVCLDAGVSVDPEAVVAAAQRDGAQALLISTYNGVALSYAKGIMTALEEAALDLPVLIGGRINQVPEASNTGLPVDVSGPLRELGVHVCADLDDALAPLTAAAERARALSPQQELPETS
ncbi:MAG: cobalamin-dependent protein [Pseudomonadota bacterium]